MRTRPKLLLVFGVVLALLLVLAACTRAPETPPPSEFTSGGSEQNNSEVEPPPESGNGEAGTGGEGTTTEESQPENSGNGDAFSNVEEDLPIPQGAYDPNISSTGHQIVFKVGGRTDQIVEYYGERLAEAGWETAGPDTVIGNTAIMVRTKPNGDRLSINMQYNPNADFTVITLVVTRN